MCARRFIRSQMPGNSIAGGHEIPQVCSAIYRWCGRMVAENVRQHEYEQAASWAWLAGFHASQAGYFGVIADPELEQHLLLIGRSLACPQRRQMRQGKPRYLHVLTEVYEVGGHTRLCRRWIELDSARHQHSVILTAQVRPLPEDFRRSIRGRGGEFTVFDPTTRLIERAQRLRALAAEHADVVVLHTHMMDPIPIMAFAVEPLPPIVFLNHAESLFWFGGSVSDLVADLSCSAQKRTKDSRGISGSVLVPVPLGQPPSAADGTRANDAVRRSERIRLGIPDDALTFLTIGAAFKYEPIGSYDFLPVALRILQAVPGAQVIAVGPRNEGRWSSAYAKSGGRLRAVGRVTDLDPLHAAADVYLEGIPCGSLTAMLEAGLAGLPCVRNPLLSGTIGHSDDPSFADVPSPKDVEEYVGAAVELAASPAKRRQDGIRLREAVMAHHCGEGWLRHLRELEARIPAKHRIHQRVAQASPNEETDFLMGLRRSSLGANGYGSLVARLYEEAQYARLRLQGGIDDDFRRELAASCERGLDETSAPTSWLGDCLAADAHFAYQQKDWRRLRKSFLACLKVSPFSRYNKELAIEVLKSFMGAKAVGKLRGIKRYLRTRLASHGKREY